MDFVVYYVGGYVEEVYVLKLVVVGVWIVGDGVFEVVYVDNYYVLGLVEV